MSQDDSGSRAANAAMDKARLANFPSLATPSALAQPPDACAGDAIIQAGYAPLNCNCGMQASNGWLGRHHEPQNGWHQTLSSQQLQPAHRSLQQDQWDKSWGDSVRGTHSQRSEPPLFHDQWHHAPQQNCDSWREGRMQDGRNHEAPQPQPAPSHPCRQQSREDDSQQGWGEIQTAKYDPRPSDRRDRAASSWQPPPGERGHSWSGTQGRGHQNQPLPPDRRASATPDTRAAHGQGAQGQSEDPGGWNEAAQASCCAPHDTQASSALM